MTGLPLLPASRHARVGVHPLGVAHMVMDDVARYYLPIHGLSSRDDLPDYTLLTFIEALICQGEEQMEQAAKDGQADVYAAWRDSKAQIRDLLRERQIEHPRIERYLEGTEAFFVQIHALVYRGELTHTNIVEAMECAPSDFRLLHVIVGEMLSSPCSDGLLDLLEPLEVLRDIHWHLAHYRDDVEHGLFNIYDMFSRLHGGDAPARVRAEQQRLEQVLDQRLSSASPSARAAIEPMLRAYRERMAEVSVPSAAL
ncbi:MAG: hypothetical protein AAGF11_36400 [Myxococcota bacterium]